MTTPPISSPQRTWKAVDWSFHKVVCIMSHNPLQSLNPFLEHTLELLDGDVEKVHRCLDSRISIRINISLTVVLPRPESQKSHGGRLTESGGWPSRSIFGLRIFCHVSRASCFRELAMYIFMVLMTLFCTKRLGCSPR
jgi:hypothetical protein